MRSATLLASLAIVTALVSNPSAGQTAAPAPAHAPSLSRAEMEGFLLKARIVRKRSAPNGITNTTRATLSDGVLTHDASIQTIDESRHEFQTAQGTEFNFRDTWRFNVAAYVLDKMLGIDMIPATVERKVDGKDASVTWWVDNVMMDENQRLKKKIEPPDGPRWNEQMWVVRVFDQLIYNTDRNLGNLIISEGWRIWMIDHSRGFRWQKSLRTPGDLARCDRALLKGLRGLDEATLEKQLGRYLGPNEIKGLLARRDAIVEFFDKSGEALL